MTRFAPGDILCAASDIDDREIDLRNHKGPGRILHFDAEFRPKGELWTGEIGLLVGLAVDRTDGTIYAADPNRRMVFRFDAEGELQGPLTSLPDRPWGTVGFSPDGVAYLGVHTQRGPAPSDAMGPDKLARADLRAGTVEASFAVDTDGGHTGWHGLTSLAFLHDGRSAAYVSEGGRRVPRYDLADGRQLADLIAFTDEDNRRAYGVASLPDGRVLVAAGGCCLMLTASGEVIADWPAASAKGWTRVTPSLDGETFFFNNFLEGVIERRRLDDGAVLARHDIKRKCVLCGVAEIGPRA
ncbi:MAG: hypothetical protein V4514_10260 [Pseudomonadota bacterium]|uniref:hypothetical protein n=1 Tax=Phenylobacterium sp. TaxID=1871053 RepID=UPI0025FAB9DE|nr:hypothetical protein [Phenylobacterium sp.]MBT9470554.1 hypothetical protein [Phenylobacterium sp.]